ncbi:UTP--glucose-1-phosphate uridylyltransferase 3, chloroplastic isoform X1 [Zingiber officinale]|uniref:UTP--glucose-1-phosphate uridylyltransferase 3, chloroplastic isoform X1 n=1 Tax=Zingiber officinale TaxID=94328 RepID=UPI001C4ADDD7|nr:UTP--glucose-1-phosphate uridylyltransferase 3, chloroplastic isoform X1 [Zingiber officinale]
MAASSAFYLRAPVFSTQPTSSSSSSFLFPLPIPHCRALLFRRPSSSSYSPSSSSSSFCSRVSTVPVEQASAPEFDFDEEIARLDALRSRLRGQSSLRKRLSIIDADSRVRSFFGARRSSLLDRLEASEVLLLKCLVAAGQEHVLGMELEWASEMRQAAGSTLRRAFYALADVVEKWSLDDTELGGNGLTEGEIGDVEFNQLKKLLKTLAEIEQFYDCIGGIIGYQARALRHLSSSKVDGKYRNSHQNFYNVQRSEHANLHVPRGLDLLQNTEDAYQAAIWGIEGLPELGEIYPLGGAGDRLGLVDVDSGECLPAALLPFGGRTLLEGLIRDLQAREFLYFKIYGKQCTTPVAIMTSSVKNNHNHITSLCEKLQWFGRSQKNFQIFEQPLVPVLTAKNGQWLITRPLSLVCKPGGHGAIWKLAHDKCIFQWFYGHGRKGATIRQVSNVVAATDLTLLALAGFGLHYGKKLGFASCQRNSGATEGINVLVEKQNHDGKWSYGITCIEYTEFEKFGIMESSITFNSFQSQFPANTNILYIDLKAAEKVGSSQGTNCLPGMVVNLKKPVSYLDHHGIQHSASGGRIECTMQNIADNFLNTYDSRCQEDIESVLDTFIVYNERRRVTSSAKKKRKHMDKSLHQTPDGALLDVMRNAYDLLSVCDIQIPRIKDNSKYIHSGPPFLIFLHPALGPVWQVTRQKFYGGSISQGSELQIEVAEFLWRNVQLSGSLIIIAENIMGSTKINQKDEPLLQYGQRCGRCKLQNVKVLNNGIDWMSSHNVYWKHDVQRMETLKIILHGNAEFEATDVVLKGSHEFIVPDGHKMRIIPENSDSGFLVKLDPIPEEMMETGSWFWKYETSETNINLEMVEL